MKIAQIVTTSDGKKFTGEDAVVKGQAHENALKLKVLFNAWADKVGMKAGKTGRRKVGLELVASWEAARSDGTLEQISFDLDAEAAAAAEAATPVEPEPAAA